MALAATECGPPHEVVWALPSRVGSTRRDGRRVGPTPFSVAWAPVPLTPGCGHVLSSSGGCPAAADAPRDSGDRPGPCAAACACVGRAVGESDRRAATLADAGGSSRRGDPRTPPSRSISSPRSRASLIRRGRPPAQRGSSAARPFSLNAWITSRTVSSSAATSRAIAGTGVPDDEAMMIVARRTRIGLPRPAAHDLGQPPTLLVGQPSRSHGSCHPKTPRSRR